MKTAEMLEAFADQIIQTLKESRFGDITVSFRLHLTSSDLTQPPKIRVPDGVHLIPARPQISNTLTALVDMVTDNGMHGIGLGVCGPLSLVSACRRAAAHVDASHVGGVVLHT